MTGQNEQYLEGIEAYFAASGLEDNPYTGEAGKNWEAGWITAAHDRANMKSVGLEADR